MTGGGTRHAAGRHSCKQCWLRPRNRLSAAGVKIAFGTDAGVSRHGENARQFAVYVTLGMSAMEARQSATRTAAELIGVSEDVGTIEAGKRADLIAVTSDPLKDIRQLEDVRFVMKAGVVVKNDTRR